MQVLPRLLFPVAPTCLRLSRVIWAPSGTTPEVVSGYLDGVGELVGNLSRKRQDQVPVERGRDQGESVDPVLGPAAFLEARNHGLGGLHPLRKLALAQRNFGAHVVDELTEIEVLIGELKRLGPGAEDLAAELEDLLSQYDTDGIAARLRQVSAER